jgi:putative ABC transport system permease protein
MALGSTPAGIVREMMRAGARVGMIGLSLGLVGALLTARAMSGLLHGLSASDPVTFVGIPVCLALIMSVATYLPARRAARLDPMSALRSD